MSDSNFDRQPTSDAKTAETPDAVIAEAPAQVSGDTHSRQAQTIPSETEKIIQWRPDQTPRAKLILELAAASVGLLAVLVYGFQLQTMNKQLDQMKTSNEVSGQAAYAACESALISRQALIDSRNSSVETHEATTAAVYQSIAARESQRAFIEIQPLPIEINRDSLGFPFRLHNTGHTAAYAMIGKLAVSFLKDGDEPDFTYLPGRFLKEKTGRVAPDSNGITLDQGQTIMLSDAPYHTQIVSPTEIQDLTLGHRILFLYATVVYRDAFGGSHHLTFCIAAKGQDGFIKSNEHNTKCADYNKSDTYSQASRSESSEPLNLQEIVCVKPKEE